MNNLTCRHFYLILAIALLCAFNSFATHMIGGEFTYQQIAGTSSYHPGAYHYQVTLTIYEDCERGEPEAIMQDNPAYFAVYNGAGTRMEVDTNISYSSSVTIAPVASCNGCTHLIASGCILKKVFSKDYWLEPSPTGYTIVYQRCCFVNAATNIMAPGDNGATYYCKIPPSGTTTHNNSAVFTNYPPRQICLGRPFTFDHSATDADGDSLSYEICASYKGASSADIKPIPVAPPYAAVDYITPLSYSNPISCSVPLTIDPVTGVMSCTPDATGKYLISVCCSEWRTGILISTISRMFVIQVTSDDSSTHRFFAGNDTTIIAGDSIRFAASGGTSYLWSPATYLNNDSVSNPLGIFPDTGTFCYILTATDSGCTGYDTVSITVFEYGMYMSTSGVSVPTAFSPNHDGKNELLRPIGVYNTRIRSFSVFNRHGKLLYSCTGDKCGWDGTYNGAVQEMDTYLWQTEYEDKKGEKHLAKGTATLIQ